jgi:hypothetical protein
VAKRFRVSGFSGLDTNNPAAPATASVVARNLLMSRPGRCETRGGLLRAHHTRVASETIWNIYEGRSSTGTIIKLVKSLDDLCTLALAGAAPASIEASLDSGGPADITQANHLFFLADQRASCYVSTGATGAALTQKLTKAAPTSALSPTDTSAGAATFTVGAYRVAYSFYNPTLDYETPPRAYESYTKANGAVGIRVTTPTDPGDGFTTMRLYRTKVGENGPFYRAGTSTTYSSTFDYTVVDTDLGLSSFPKSTVHNDDGEIVAANPTASKFACWHKHQLAFGSDSSNLLRITFSELDRPCQFFVQTIAKVPTHYHDLEEGQGRKMTGLNTFGGGLVCFKDYSVTIRNGDVDPSSWVWFVAVDGIGCVAPWTRAVVPGHGIFFAGADGVYMLDAGFRAVKISDKPDGSGIGDDYRALDFSKVEYWWGAWSEKDREYLLGVTTSSASGNVPDRVYSFSPDTGNWTTREYGMGLILPTCAGVLTNGSSQPKVYLGTSTGFCYETGWTTLQDGPQSGTVTGTATAGSGVSTIVDSTASFFATGDDLTGQVCTVRTVTGSVATYESRLIDAGNTGTSFDVTSAFSADPTGKTYYIGAIRSTLALAGHDAGEPDLEKRWAKVGGAWTKQSHTVPVRIGFTLDDSTVPSYAGTEQTCGDVRFNVDVSDRAVECGAYLDVIGTTAPIELKSITYEVAEMNTRNPAA